MSAAATRTFYKLDVQGIVYLVDPATGTAYTYDLSDPVEIGKVTWTNPKESPTIAMRPDWNAVLSRKIATVAAPTQ
jgi:hypothetical protein